MDTMDEETLVRRPSFTIPNVMDLLRKSRREPEAVKIQNEQNEGLLPKEEDCCDAATD